MSGCLQSSSRSLSWEAPRLPRPRSKSKRSSSRGSESRGSKSDMVASENEQRPKLLADRSTWMYPAERAFHDAHRSHRRESPSDVGETRYSRNSDPSRAHPAQ